VVERQISMLRFLADDGEQGRRPLGGFAEPLPPSVPTGFGFEGEPM